MNILKHNTKNVTAFFVSQCRCLETFCRIGCASGFWGDSTVASHQLIDKGKIDFLVFDYLSEITMSLLCAAKMKDPTLGYTPDFIDVGVGPYLKEIHKKGIRVVANAGGINQQACAKALHNAASKAGVNLDIAIVTGDDLMAKRSELGDLKDMDTGLPLPAGVQSMNAYFGATPISRALDMGAAVVITGRCVDSALALGPLLHRFKWQPDDYDKLAGGSLAGHLIECGAQVTGGIFTDHEKVSDWWNIGFPVAECHPDGSCLITKPDGTGGLVSRGTVCEQLVYEIGDPAAYLLPDVVCDFSNVEITEVKDRDNCVLVTGAKGKPPTDSFKVCATYTNGYRLTAVAVVIGDRAVEKSRRTGQEILKRVEWILARLKLPPFRRTHLQVLGAEESYGPNARTTSAPRETVIWLAAEHEHRRALEILAREIAPAGTGMAPGLAGIAGGRPKVSPILKLHSSLLNKSQVQAAVEMGERREPIIFTAAKTSPSPPTQSAAVPTPQLVGPASYRLGELAWLRSGDKGDTCNIGVVARSPAIWPVLRARLTDDVVGCYFAHCFPQGDYRGRVIRYELAGIQGLNFVLKNSLGGGGIASLRPDPQGKGYAQMLVDLVLNDLPENMTN